MIAVSPGDVLAVDTGSWLARIIELGEWLHGLPHDVNHVVVAHHVDDAGVFWGIEGRPGGVGWVDMRPYFRSRHVFCNGPQPKSTFQRDTVIDTVEQMLGTQYDWAGIGADACRDLDLPTLFASDWRGQGTPGHVVCSSLAAYVYDRVGLSRPGLRAGARWVQPGDWQGFIEKKGWVR